MCNAQPIILPELGAEAGVRVSSWLVDLGDEVEAGDRLVEVLLRGVTFDVAAPAAGILVGIARPVDSTVRGGDTLGWIQMSAEQTEADAPPERDE